MKSDLPSLVRWINDPEVTMFLATYLPMSETDEEEWLANLGKRKSNNIVLAIETIEGVLIGSMGIHNIDWSSRTATTGALIGEKEYWGKGYGSEAKLLLLEYAFNTLGLRKIFSDVIAFNTRSIRYSEKCGYVIEARLKDCFFRRNKYWNKIILSVTRKTWLPVWKQFKKTGKI